MHASLRYFLRIQVATLKINYDKLFNIEKIKEYTNSICKEKRRVFSSNYRFTSCNHSANIFSNFLCLSHCPENKIWHLINTIQSSCPSLGQHKRLIRLYVWQEGNMLPFCTPRFSLLPHSTPQSSATMQILTAWDWYLKRDNNVLLGPVRTEGTEFIVCWDSSRVLQKRLFHLAVDGLINNTAVCWWDLVFLTDLFPGQW